MNIKGRSIDNIAIKRFFRLLKYEDIYLKRYVTLKETKEGIENYIRLYNTKRLHLALDYKTLGGGCFLTLESFSNKIKDFIKYDKLEKEDINLLKYGRHLRLSDGTKLVIRRHKIDNEHLLSIKSSKFSFFNLHQIIGPVALLSNNATKNDINLSRKLVLTYAKTNKDEPYTLTFNSANITQTPYPIKQIAQNYFVV